MSLATTLTLYAGGPGSGPTAPCPQCGPKGEHQLSNLLKDAQKVFGADNPWSVLYKHGHAGKVEPFTPEEQQELKQLMRGIPKCKLGYCYMNAQRIAFAGVDNPKVKYMEGLVTVHGVPLEHAYIEYNGKVFDPAMDARELKHEYYGVEVPKQFIWKNQLETKKYTPVSENPRFRGRIFK